MIIGLERSSYQVNENAGSVVVCAILRESVQMESNRIFSVTLTTSDGGKDH